MENPNNDYIDLVGKYTTARIFTPNVEDEAVQQIQAMCDSVAFEGSHIRIMPDCHKGAGCTIGSSIPLDKFVDPNMVGVDIGCTISLHKMSKPLKEEDYVVFEHRVKKAIPTGFDVHSGCVCDKKELYAFLTKEYAKARSACPSLVPEIGTIDENFVADLLARVHMDKGLWYKSIGTLGGGNHFLEYDENSTIGECYFSIHCGSRNFGVKVCNYWSKIANSTKASKAELKQKIAEIKANCTDKTQLKDLIENAKKEATASHPVGFLCGDDLKGYISDMVIAQAYAFFNHMTIKQRVFDIFQKLDGIICDESIWTIHNYISVADEHPMIRKGAVDASEGKKLVIPFNMRDGIAICEGKGNPEWNCTAPHGAGRLMSRTAAKKNIKMEDFADSMKDVYSTTVCKGTLDEAPQAYKPMDEIVRLIEPTVNIITFVKPRINIKATESE